MAVVLTWLGYGILTVGVFFALVGSIGVVRLPDFYTRAHAATKPDTLGMGLSMIGIAILHGVAHGIGTTTFKLLLILVFVVIANPAAAHALGRAAARTARYSSHAR